MKEQSLIEMKNKIQSLTNVMEHMIQELDYLRTVSFGTLETIKQMSEYDNALANLDASSETYDADVAAADTAAKASATTAKNNVLSA